MRVEVEGPQREEAQWMLDVDESVHGRVLDDIRPYLDIGAVVRLTAVDQQLSLAEQLRRVYCCVCVYIGIQF